jgi:hypothetical protein
MIGGSIVLGLVLLGAIAKAIGWSRAHAQPPDLGSVSRRWLAEHHFF